MRFPSRQIKLFMGEFPISNSCRKVFTTVKTSLLSSSALVSSLFLSKSIKS